MEIEAEIVPGKSAPSRSAEQRKVHGRSKVTNGKDLLPGIDGRSLIARRFRATR
jgi:hypothetical protein